MWLRIKKKGLKKDELDAFDYLDVDGFILAHVSIKDDKDSGGYALVIDAPDINYQKTFVKDSVDKINKALVIVKENLEAIDQAIEMDDYDTEKIIYDYLIDMGDELRWL